MGKIYAINFEIRDDGRLHISPNDDLRSAMDSVIESSSAEGVDQAAQFAMGEMIAIKKTVDQMMLAQSMLHILSGLAGNHEGDAESGQTDPAVENNVIPFRIDGNKTIN